jgi:hypothetical protein
MAARRQMPIEEALLRRTENTGPSRCAPRTVGSISASGAGSLATAGVPPSQRSAVEGPAWPAPSFMALRCSFSRLNGLHFPVVQSSWQGVRESGLKRLDGPFPRRRSEGACRAYLRRPAPPARRSARLSTPWNRAVLRPLRHPLATVRAMVAELSQRRDQPSSQRLPG